MVEVHQAPQEVRTPPQHRLTQQEQLKVPAMTLSVRWRPLPSLKMHLALGALHLPAKSPSAACDQVQQRLHAPSGCWLLPTLESVAEQPLIHRVTWQAARQDRTP